jgi:23S rRNA (cytosine1962-C5)-methyltransferase
MDTPLLPDLLDRCIRARATLFDPAHESAFRLFNGFTEGLPDLVIDIYAATAIFTNYADSPQDGLASISSAQECLRSRLPWLRAGILKTRNSPSASEKAGVLLFGEQPDGKIREHGVWYAVNPVVHQDASLYLDTRNVRRWALENIEDKTVLNTFAYTGSLGVAARAGGARRVIQLDRNRVFLEVAKASYALNGFPIDDADFIRADFFRQVGAFKRQGATFDSVFLDPPFFSSSPTGVVDLVEQSARMVNKVRPLVNDGGKLITINNAVFVSGREYLHTLEGLCADGYLSISEIIPVPEDFTGYANTRVGAPIVDPEPFNHSTKIAVLRVKRKQARNGQ